MQAGRRQQGGHMQRHGALGGVEDEELAPRHAQQRHLGGQEQAEVKQCQVYMSKNGLNGNILWVHHKEPNLTL